MQLSMNHDEDVDDDVLLSLLAVGEDDDDVEKSKRRPRGVPATDIWSNDALTRAWAAAIEEYRAYAAAAPALPTALDREQQLLASPLWYAPLAPVPADKKRKIQNTHVQSANSVATNDVYEDDAGDQEGYDDYEESYNEDADYNQEEPEHKYEPAPAAKHSGKEVSNDEVDMDEGIDDQEELLQAEEPDDGDLHEGEPYFNPAEYEPVLATGKVSKNTIHSNAQAKVASSQVNIPEPPTTEKAFQHLDSAIISTQTSQEALEKALNAWYNAGYAAALYHVRSGMVKP